MCFCYYLAIYERKSILNGSQGITFIKWGFIVGLRVHVRVCTKEKKTLELEVFALPCIFQYNTYVLFIPQLISVLSLNLLCHHGLLYSSMSLCVQDLESDMLLAHLLSPFNSSLPIRPFRPLFLRSRHSSLLGEVPFLLMRRKWAVGIAKRSGADSWRHFTTALHENTNRVRPNKTWQTQAVKGLQHPMTQKAQRLATCN